MKKCSCAMPALQKAERVAGMLHSLEQLGTNDGNPYAAITEAKKRLEVLLWQYDREAGEELRGSTSER